MSHITIVFTRRHALGSVLLRAWMHSRFSHCALVDLGTDTVVEASVHGVRERTLDSLLDDSSDYDIVHVPCRDPARVLAEARNEIGKPYDWLGVAGFWFRRNWERPTAWFCSELVAGLLERVGEPAFRVKPYRVSPEHLYMPMFDR